MSARDDYPELALARSRQAAAALDELDRLHSEAPNPTVTRHQDGRLSIDWNTSDGTQPNGWIKASPEVLAMFVDEHNNMHAALAAALSAQRRREQP